MSKADFQFRKSLEDTAKYHWANGHGCFCWHPFKWKNKKGRLHLVLWAYTMLKVKYKEFNVRLWSFDLHNKAELWYDLFHQINIFCSCSLTHQPGEPILSHPPICLHVPRVHKYRAAQLLSCLHAKHIHQRFPKKKSIKGILHKETLCMEDRKWHN